MGNKKYQWQKISVAKKYTHLLEKLLEKNKNMKNKDKRETEHNH